MVIPSPVFSISGILLLLSGIFMALLGKRWIIRIFGRVIMVVAGFIIQFSYHMPTAMFRGEALFQLK